MHKTGTKSVQNILISNTKYLDELGYKAFVNLPQMNAKHPDRFDSDWLGEQVELAKNNNLKGVIFSAEMISTFNLRQMRIFFDVFNQHEIIVVSCFRHWVSFLPSRWAQNCKRRDSQSLPSYINNLRCNDKTHIDARFDLIISRLIEINPDVIRLVSFDNAVANVGLVPTVLSAFDFPVAVVERMYNPSTKHLNIGKSIKQSDLVRLFNGVYSLKCGVASNELFDSVNHAIIVKHQYNNSKKVLGFLDENDENKKLKSILLCLLEEQSKRFVLSRSDSFITEWEEAANLVGRQYIYNPVESRLFGEISDNEIVCSVLDADEVPCLLQNEMMNFLNSIKIIST